MALGGPGLAPVLIDSDDDGVPNEAFRQDGRTRIGKLQREIEDARACSWGWNGMARIASEVAPPVRGQRNLRKRMAAPPRLNVSSWNNDALLAQFGNGGNGRPLTEASFGCV